MVFGSRMEGGTQILPARVRKTIQSIKEIVGNHSDADIYVALRETNMDPNETAQKLLNQGYLFFLFLNIGLRFFCWFILVILRVFSMNGLLVYLNWFLAVKLANRCFLVNGFGWNVGIVSGRMWKFMGKVVTGRSNLAWVFVYHVNWYWPLTPLTSIWIFLKVLWEWVVCFSASFCFTSVQCLWLKWSLRG